jgi:hypothetical protein
MTAIPKVEASTLFRVFMGLFLMTIAALIIMDFVFMNDIVKVLKKTEMQDLNETDDAKKQRAGDAILEIYVKSDFIDTTLLEYFNINLDEDDDNPDDNTDPTLTTSLGVIRHFFATTEYETGKSIREGDNTGNKYMKDITYYKSDGKSNYFILSNRDKFKSIINNKKLNKSFAKLFTNNDKIGNTDKKFIDKGDEDNRDNTAKKINDWGKDNFHKMFEINIYKDLKCEKSLSYHKNNKMPWVFNGIYTLLMLCFIGLLIWKNLGADSRLYATISILSVGVLGISLTETIFRFTEYERLKPRCKQQIANWKWKFLQGIAPIKSVLALIVTTFIFAGIFFNTKNLQDTIQKFVGECTKNNSAK